MIKNLLFDIGGVVMDIRRENCAEAFRALGFEDIDAFLGDFSQKGPFAALESGAITAAGFRQQVRGHLPQGGSGVSDAQIDAAFEAFLVGIPRERLEQLRALGQRYALYYLSNTNPIMWPGRIAREFAQEGLGVGAYFRGGVTSYSAGMMKPQPGIFRYTAQTLGIEPAATLFLDDSEANCQAARAEGFHALHVPQDKGFYNVLKAHSLA